MNRRLKSGGDIGLAGGLPRHSDGSLLDGTPFPRRRPLASARPKAAARVPAPPAPAEAGGIARRAQNVSDPRGVRIAEAFSAFHPPVNSHAASPAEMQLLGSYGAQPGKWVFAGYGISPAVIPRRRGVIFFSFG